MSSFEIYGFGPFPPTRVVVTEVCERCDSVNRFRSTNQGRRICQACCGVAHTSVTGPETSGVAADTLKRAVYE